jgi:hypothetical protein
LTKITWTKGAKNSHAGHSRIRSAQYAEGRLQADRNGRADWQLRSNGAYEARVEGDYQTRQQSNREESSERTVGVFDDANESKQVDFADMLKGDPYQARSEGDGVIHVVKTVEVTADDGLAESSSSSDTDESTRKLGV